MRGLAVGAATLAIGVQAALPQGSAAESRYVGRVVDAANGAAVGGVNVQVVGAGLIQVTDAAGRFRFVGLAAGTYVITARRLGYGERSDSIQVAAADTVTHVLLMSRVPVALSEIVISGKSLRFPQYFEPAYKRLARGRGFFVTREDIAAWTAKDFEAILNRGGDR